MKTIIAICLLLAGCAEMPQKCVTAHSLGVSIKSTDPRVPAVEVAPTETTVCVTPAYIDGVR